MLCLFTDDWVSLGFALRLLGFIVLMVVGLCFIVWVFVVSICLFGLGCFGFAFIALALLFSVGGLVGLGVVWCSCVVCFPLV